MKCFYCEYQVENPNVSMGSLAATCFALGAGTISPMAGAVQIPRRTGGQRGDESTVLANPACPCGFLSAARSLTISSISLMARRRVRRQRPPRKIACIGAAAYCSLISMLKK